MILSKFFYEVILLFRERKSRGQVLIFNNCLCAARRQVFNLENGFNATKETQGNVMEERGAGRSKVCPFFYTIELLLRRFGT